MEQKRERIWELDALRSSALSVIFVHFMFDLVLFLQKAVSSRRSYLHSAVRRRDFCRSVRLLRALGCGASGAACWSLGAVMY